MEDMYMYCTYLLVFGQPYRNRAANKVLGYYKPSFIKDIVHSLSLYFP